jgi:hypothetical protein
VSVGGGSVKISSATQVVSSTPKGCDMGIHDDRECLDGPDGCGGDTFPRAALSGSGERYSRCDVHYEAYAERLTPRMAEIRSRYPEMAPPDFDFMAAGERWAEDDPWP